MIQSKKLFAPLFVALHILCTINAQTFQLSKFDYKSAAVLPTVTKRNEKWAVLAREGYGITKKHTYDAFSGGRDEGETDVTFSAAREFHEEAILEHVLRWGLKETERFINPDKTENTWLVIAYEKDKDINNPKSRIIRNVTFITNFNKYKTKFFNNFYDARKREIARYEAEGIPGKYRTTTEKDRIARVRWTDLKYAIINQENPDDSVYVCAEVMDPITQKFNKETITLRPILVITLRPFFLSKDYEKGENEKIRYYEE
jgi:hypothetical protein